MNQIPWILQNDGLDYFSLIQELTVAYDQFCQED